MTDLRPEEERTDEPHDLGSEELVGREELPASCERLVVALNERGGELASFNEAVDKTTAFRASLGNSPITAENFVKAVLLSTETLVRGFSAMQKLGTIARTVENRDRAVSQSLVPIVFLAIDRKGEMVSDPEKDFAHLYTATHPEGLIIDKRLAGLLELLEIKDLDIFPDRQTYFENSPSQKETGLQLLEDLKKAESEAQNASDAGQMAADRKVDNIKRQVDSAFSNIRDLDPLDLDELLGKVTVKLIYGAPVLEAYTAFSASLISILSAGLGIEGASLPERIEVPLVTEEGDLLMYPAVIDDPGAFLQPELLNRILNSICRNRHVLSECAGKLGEFWTPGGRGFDSMTRGFDKCLEPLPFLNELAARRPEGTERELMRLMTQPSRGNPKVGHGEYEVDFAYADLKGAYQQFDFAVRKYMTAEDELASDFEGMFRQCKPFSESVVSQLKALRRAVASGDFKSAAELAEAMIEPPANTKLDLEIARPAMLIALSQITEEPSVAGRLKSRIRNIENLREMLAPVYSSDARSALEALLPNLRKRLSNTLDDFYGNEAFVDRIRTAMGRFLHASLNPALFDGITPDKILRNSVFIYGPPGAGKTYFVDCLANEFELEMREISIETAEDGKSKNIMSVEDKILALEQKFAEVQALAAERPCIAFIDEFEEYAADRRNPLTTADQKKLTTYMNRKIVEIRQKHPNIFLVSASNFEPKDVDEAVLRDGRFDIVIELRPPGIEDIKKIIAGAVAMEAPNLELAPDELNDVSGRAFGLMPFSIIKTITEICRFGTEDEDLSYDSLLAAIVQTVEDRAIDIERNKPRVEANREASQTSA